MIESDQKEFLRLLQIFKEDQKNRIPFSEELFSALLQCVPMPSIECVIARVVNDQIHVFLTRRPADDPFYSRLWHVPGTFLRPRETIASAMRRMQEGELAEATIVNYKFVFPNNNWCEPRGHSVGLVHLCEMIGEPREGDWFQVWPGDYLPPDFIQFQHDFLMSALTPLFIDRPGNWFD